MDSYRASSAEKSASLSRQDSRKAKERITEKPGALAPGFLECLPQEKTFEPNTHHSSITHGGVT
jgi:hypothetical protein